MRIWIIKSKEVLSSVLPIVVIVIFLGLFITPLGLRDFARFLLGAFCIVLGLILFLIGVDRSVTQFGQRLGDLITRPNKVALVAVAGIIIGFIISAAEPDLHILASQIAFVTGGLIQKWPIVIVVSAGIAILVSTGLIRSLYNFPLYKLLTVLYGIVLVLALFSSPEFLAISFDASGATTGAITVPFLLALMVGIALMKKNSKASEKDSFGLIGLASSGVIIAVLLMGLVMPKSEFAATIDFNPDQQGLHKVFLTQLIRQFIEALIAVAPLYLLFVAVNLWKMKLTRRVFIKFSVGFSFALLGLTLILTGANAGFIDTGRSIGSRLAEKDNKSFLVVISFILGLVTVLSEPAVHILSRQIEDVTSGSVRRKAVLLALSVGVGAAVALSILRILIPPLQLWHILLPAYAATLVLAHVGSKLFVGIAFDSGGVASGPMTATFILAFAQGAANSFHSANVVVDGFGVIALVATTPIITLQILGLIYRKKALRKGGIKNV